MLRQRHKRSDQHSSFVQTLADQHITTAEAGASISAPSAASKRVFRNTQLAPKDRGRMANLTFTLSLSG